MRATAWVMAAVVLAGCGEPVGDSVTITKAPGDLFVSDLSGRPTWDRVEVSIEGSCFLTAVLEEWPTKFTVYKGPVFAKPVPVALGDQLLVDMRHAPQDSTCQITLAFEGAHLGAWMFTR